jgi:hypothetical protein
MGTKVESYRADDGTLFATEREMVMHEIGVTLRKEFPALKIQLGAIVHSADRLLEILLPLAGCPPKNHPQSEAQTTPEPPVAVRCRYAHPPGTRCPICQDVPRHITVVPAPEARAAHG